jgi:hypothetical protein
MAAKAKTAAAKAKCRICLKNKPHSRGACQSCLREMRTLIRLGRISKGKAMEVLLLPPKKLGRKARPSPVLAKLNGHK